MQRIAKATLPIIAKYTALGVLLSAVAVTVAERYQLKCEGDVIVMAIFSALMAKAIDSGYRKGQMSGQHSKSSL